MAFEKYTNQIRALPAISINKLGSIFVNSAARLEYGLTDKQYYQFYYDKETNRIALETTKIKEVTNRKPTFRNGMLIFNALGFLRFIEYDYSQTNKYELVYDDIERLYIIDFNKPLVARKGRATK